MSKIISIANMKGGVGKSQVSILLATALSQTPFNLKTCIIDLDFQKSILDIRNLDLQAYETENAPFEVLDFRLSDLKKNIGKLDKEYDLIFLDVAGKLDIDLPIESQEITNILMYVDFVFMPFVAGNHNLKATIKYFQFITHIQDIRQLQPRSLHIKGFLNMYRARSRANSFLNEDIEVLKEKESLQMLNTPLNDYALFRESDTITSIYDPLSNDSAKQNFAAFVNEFISIIQ